jgi:hypothetical protein
MKKIQIALMWLGINLIAIGVASENIPILFIGYSVFIVGVARTTPREIDLKPQQRNL